MVIMRRVTRQKRQILIAVPPEFRKALNAKPGSVLYWHTYRQGEAILAVKATRGGGKPPVVDRGPAIAALEHEIERLKARLHSQRGSIWNEYASQEYMRRLSIELRGLPVLDAISARLAMIEAALALPKPPRRSSVPRPPLPPPPPAVVAGSVDAHPSPSSPPPVVSSGGDEASGAERPQASH